MKMGVLDCPGVIINGGLVTVLYVIPFMEYDAPTPDPDLGSVHDFSPVFEIDPVILLI